MHRSVREILNRSPEGKSKEDSRRKLLFHARLLPPKSCRRVQSDHKRVIGKFLRETRATYQARYAKEHIVMSSFMLRLVGVDQVRNHFNLFDIASYQKTTTKKPRFLFEKLNHLNRIAYLSEDPGDEA